MREDCSLYWIGANDTRVELPRVRVLVEQRQSPLRQAMGTNRQSSDGFADARTPVRIEHAENGGMSASLAVSLIARIADDTRCRLFSARRRIV